MLANVTRDAQLLPALRTAMAGATRFRASVEDILAAGWPGGREHDERRRAAIAVALEFTTWRVLATRLGDGESATLMTSMVAAAS